MKLFSGEVWWWRGAVTGNLPSVPERVDAVDAARHVLSVVYVCRFWIKDLKQRQGRESERHLERTLRVATGVPQE